jgi:Family of unknown function (DUF5325)
LDRREHRLKKVNGFFLLLALLGTLSFIGMGIFIAEGSFLGVLSSILLLIFVMGLGFSKKKKMKEKETV